MEEHGDAYSIHSLCHSRFQTCLYDMQCHFAGTENEHPRFKWSKCCVMYLY